MRTIEEITRTEHARALRFAGPIGPRKVARDTDRILKAVGDTPLSTEVILPGTHKHSFITGNPAQDARIARARQA